MMELMAIAAGRIRGPAAPRLLTRTEKGGTGAGHGGNKQGSQANHGADFADQPGLLRRVQPARQVAKAVGGQRWGQILWLLYIDQRVRNNCRLGPGSRPLQP
jgi:hypothetical protein